MGCQARGTENGWVQFFHTLGDVIPGQWAFGRHVFGGQRPKALRAVGFANLQRGGKIANFHAPSPAMTRASLDHRDF